MINGWKRNKDEHGYDLQISLFTSIIQKIYFWIDQSCFNKMLNKTREKILILSAVFPPEPVVSAKLSFDIANKLSENNSVTVISPKPSRPFGFKFMDETMVLNFNHIQVSSFTSPASGVIGRFRESYSFGKHCYTYIANNHQNIDIIYANTWPLFGQYYAVKAAKKYNIPIIIHVQDIYPESLSQKLPFAASFFNNLLIPLDKYILGNASKVIAISKKMKSFLESSRKLDNNKITVVSNWQDEESFQKEESFDRSKPFTFMYLGNIGPVAGVDLLLNAFAKTYLKNARLVIAGAGSLKESLVTQTANYPDAMIEFWAVPDGQVPKVQSKADVLILPVKKGAASTSIPSKLPAYMFSAKPIIGCVDADSDTAAAINDARCGWVIESEKVESLTALMLEIVQVPAETRRQFGENGKNYAMENYSKKSNLQKLISIIIQPNPS